MNTLNLKENLTFNGEQVAAIKELVRKKLYALPELQDIHTIYSNILVNKAIGFIGEGGMVGMKDTGCNPTAQSFGAPVTEKEWQPVAWFARVEECYKDLLQTAARYSMKNGVEMADLSDTDYMVIVVETLVRALRKFVLRVAYFGDKDAETVTNEGLLKASVDPDFFNLFDGFFKQIDDDDEVTAITPDYSTPAKAQKTLHNLYYAAPVALRQQEDLVFLVSQKVYDLYEQSLSGTELSIMYQNLVDGVKRLTLNGIPVIAMPIWDEIATANYQDARPFTERAILTCKANLCLGFDSADTVSKVEVNYDWRDKKVVLDAAGQMDAKVFDGNLVAIAAYTAQ